MNFTAVRYAAVLASIWGIAVLIGCKRPDTEIGLGYAQEDLLTLYQSDSIPLAMFTVREDSLQTSHLSTAVLGQMEHPEFGVHQAGFATQLRLSAPDFDFGQDPIIDSIYLSLKYTGDSYGQLNPQYFQVLELADSLSLDSSYYSNTFFQTQPESLEDPLFQPVIIHPTEPLYLGNDTVSPEVRIYLKDEFGQRLLDAGSDVFESNQSWLAHLPGLQIMPAPGSDGRGAVGIDISSGFSRMRLHFHNALDSNLVFEFTISSLSARNNFFNHQWYPPFQALDEPMITSVNGSQVAGVFSGAGLKTRVQFPNLVEWEESLDEDRAVHKAELWLPVDPTKNDPRYPWPAQLFILTEDEDGEAISTPDQNSIGLNINGNYDPSEQAYRFNISQTFQQMLNGTFPSDRLYVVSSRAGISLQGVVLNGTEAAVADGDTTASKANARIVVTWSE